MSARLEQRTFRAVGTTRSVAVTAGHADGRPARLALLVTPSRGREGGRSRFDAASDLSRLNRNAGTWVTVDVRLVEALALAVRARAATNGRFDPSKRAAGYDRSFEQLEERPPRTG